MQKLYRIRQETITKTLKTILLSGGEKAFIAIAPYFSILKVHPTPFCVMDEIEAALGGVNVTRSGICASWRAGRSSSSSPTAGTMEEADVLYGVTMQEKGVSKMLTTNLNDMAKELDIHWGGYIMSLKRKRALATILIAAGTVIFYLGTLARTSWLRVVLMFAGAAEIGAGIGFFTGGSAAPAAARSLAETAAPDSARIAGGKSTMARNIPNFLEGTIWAFLTS